MPSYSARDIAHLARKEWHYWMVRTKRNSAETASKFLMVEATSGLKKRSGWYLKDRNSNPEDSREGPNVRCMEPRC